MTPRISSLGYWSRQAEGQIGNKQDRTKEESIKDPLTDYVLVFVVDIFWTVLQSMIPFTFSPKKYKQQKSQSIPGFLLTNWLNHSKWKVNAYYLLFGAGRCPASVIVEPDSSRGVHRTQSFFSEIKRIFRSTWPQTLWPILQRENRKVLQKRYNSVNFLTDPTYIVNFRLIIQQHRKLCASVLTTLTGITHSPIPMDYCWAANSGRWTTMNRPSNVPISYPTHGK